MKVLLCRDGLKEINKRIARGEHAEVLLLKPRLKDGVSLFNIVVF